MHRARIKFLKTKIDKNIIKYTMKTKKIQNRSFEVEYLLLCDRIS